MRYSCNKDNTFIRTSKNDRSLGSCIPTASKAVAEGHILLDTFSIGIHKGGKWYEIHAGVYLNCCFHSKTGNSLNWECSAEAKHRGGYSQDKRIFISFKNLPGQQPQGVSTGVVKSWSSLPWDICHHYFASFKEKFGFIVLNFRFEEEWWMKFTSIRSFCKPKRLIFESSLAAVISILVWGLSFFTFSGEINQWLDQNIAKWDQHLFDNLGDWDWKKYL